MGEFSRSRGFERINRFRGEKYRICKEDQDKSQDDRRAFLDHQHDLSLVDAISSNQLRLRSEYDFGGRRPRFQLLLALPV